jgi:hypothetical protein
VGLTIETETWQPGKVMTNKINTDHTFPDSTNYWAPLEDNNKEKQDKEINIIKQANTEQNPKPNKWKQRIERRQEKQSQQSQHSIIIDSGATSHFMSKDLNLPRTGLSQIEVFLPDNSKLQSSRKTQLPFQQLAPKPREADIIPGLTKSLLSINKMSENGYTTVSLSGNKGVTIHKEGTLTIMTSEPPVLQGCKAN